MLNKFKKLYYPELDKGLTRSNFEQTLKTENESTSEIEETKLTRLENFLAKMAGDSRAKNLVPSSKLEYFLNKIAKKLNNIGDSAVVENAKANGGIGWKEPGTVLYEDHDTHYAGANITITQPFLELANGQEYTLTVTIDNRVTTVTSAVSAERDERTGNFICYAISLIGVAPYNSLNDAMTIRYYLSGYNSISLPYPPAGMDVVVNHIEIATPDTVHKISSEMSESPLYLIEASSMDVGGTLNKTYNEIHAAYENGKIPIVSYDDGYHSMAEIHVEASGLYCVRVHSTTGNPLLFVSSGPDDVLTVEK